MYSPDNSWFMVIEVTSKNRKMGIVSFLGNSHKGNENATFIEL